MQRTRVITAASVLGVVLAGGAAVGANLGILNASASSELGSLEAADSSLVADLTPAERAAWKVVVVGDAGSVTLSVHEGELRVVSAEAVDGWKRSIERPHEGQVRATFTNGTRTLVMLATLAVDGSVSATVEEAAASSAGTAVVASPAPWDTTSSGTGGSAGTAGPTFHDDDDDHGGGDDHDDDDDDDHDDDRRRGGHDDDD